MYEQDLVKTIEPIKKTTISRLNKGRKWKYGYDKEHDIIVLSHNGVIGEVIEIQGLVIALPKAKMCIATQKTNGLNLNNLKN